MFQRMLICSPCNDNSLMEGKLSCFTFVVKSSKIVFIGAIHDRSCNRFSLWLHIGCSPVLYIEHCFCVDHVKICSMRFFSLLMNNTFIYYLCEAVAFYYILLCDFDVGALLGRGFSPAGPAWEPCRIFGPHLRLKGSSFVDSGSFNPAPPL